MQGPENHDIVYRAVGSGSRGSAIPLIHAPGLVAAACDVYGNWVNPLVIGNGARVFAESQPLHDFGYSAALVLPANSILVFSW